MTVARSALRRAAALVPVDDGTRAALVDDATELGHVRGRLGAWAEITALLGLAIELRVAPEDRDRPLGTGLWLGGELTLAFAAGALAVQAAGNGAPAVALLAVAAAASALLARRRPRAAPFGAAALAVVAASAASGGLIGISVASLVALGAAAIVVGSAPARAGARDLLVTSTVASIAVAAAGLVGSTTAVGALGVPMVAVIAGLLLASRPDPRLAVAAAVLACWRFVAYDPSGLVALGRDIVTDGATVPLVARWVLMASGFTFAALVSGHRVRSAATT